MLPVIVTSPVRNFFTSLIFLYFTLSRQGQKALKISSSGHFRRS